MHGNDGNRSRAASVRGFMALFAIAPLAALGILAGAVPAARAADTTCPPIPISGTTINGNLAVPAGHGCLLEGTVTVTGNVHVGKGASLTVQPFSGRTVTIGGNVQAVQCNTAFLIPAGGAISVGGNVQIRNCTRALRYGYAGPITIGGNFACDHNSPTCTASGGKVRGNVQVNNNSGSFGTNVEVEGNTIDGNVQVNNNSGSSGINVAVEGNTIGGNLRCTGNSPGVTDFGVPNTVAGNKQGQCAGANF